MRFEQHIQTLSIQTFELRFCHVWHSLCIALQLHVLLENLVLFDNLVLVQYHQHCEWADTDVFLWNCIFRWSEKTHYSSISDRLPDLKRPTHEHKEHPTIKAALLPVRKHITVITVFGTQQKYICRLCTKSRHIFWPMWPCTIQSSILVNRPV